MMTIRQAGPGSIIITVTQEEIDALADQRVPQPLVGRARSWQLQDDVLRLVNIRPGADASLGAAISWTCMLQRAVSRRAPELRRLYRNQCDGSWLVSDRIGSTLTSFEPDGSAVDRNNGLALALLDFADRPHVGHVTAEGIWEAAIAATKLDRPDVPLVLRTDAADVMVNAALALTWIAASYTMGENLIRISFAKSAEWLMAHTWNDAKKLAPPVKFECGSGCSWLAPLRALPTENDPVLDLRGSL